MSRLLASQRCRAAIGLWPLDTLVLALSWLLVVGLEWVVGSYVRFAMAR